MKQLSSLLALNVNGGDRISYTYDEVDDTTGELISSNNKGSFVVIDESLRSSLNSVRDYIRTNKLAD